LALESRPQSRVVQLVEEEWALALKNQILALKDSQIFAAAVEAALAQM
jgi:hypothetical protein